MNAVPSTGGICHLVPQTRSWCPRSPPESPAQAGGAARRDCRGFYSTAPHGASQGGYPTPLMSLFPSGHWGGAGTELGTALQDRVSPPQECPWCWLGLGGTWAVPRGYPSSRSRRCALMLCRAPRSHRDWNRPPPLGGCPWGPSAPPLSCYRGRARHRGAPCPGHEGHLPGSLTAPEAAAAPLAPHALRPRGRLSPGAPGRPPTPGGHGRRARAVPAGPAGRAL